jgi:hypothetical protein
LDEDEHEPELLYCSHVIDWLAVLSRDTRPASGAPPVARVAPTAAVVVTAVAAAKTCLAERLVLGGPGRRDT